LGCSVAPPPLPLPSLGKPQPIHSPPLRFPDRFPYPCATRYVTRLHLIAMPQPIFPQLSAFSPALPSHPRPALYY